MRQVWELFSLEEQVTDDTEWYQKGKNTGAIVLSLATEVR